MPFLTETYIHIHIYIYIYISIEQRHKRATTKFEREGWREGRGAGRKGRKE